MRTPATASTTGREFRRDFARDERGNIAILFALFVVPVLLVIGLAIDGSRAHNAATTTTNALDAAALAAARAMADGSLSDADVKDVATRYFEANVHGDGKPSYATYGTLDVSANRNTGEVKVAIDTIVPTTFGQLAHIDNFTMRREATALAGVGEIELGLMLDVTGSMDGRKLEALKDATKDLLDIIIPPGQYADRVRVGLAPYSEQVNMGRFAELVSDDDNPTGCVVERTNSDLNDDTGVSGRNNKFHVLTPDEMTRYRRSRCPDAEILPLTSDKQLIIDTVDLYRADGWTAGHLGIQWAWNLISPQWRGVWGGESQPKGYGTKDLIKAVVLMTDGEFNTAYTGRSGRGSMTNESYGHASDLCSALRNKDVLVFSVAFELRERRARQALENCATNEDYFYRAENEQELRDAYRKIAIKLTNLRLSQ